MTTSITGGYADGWGPELRAFPSPDTALLRAELESEGVPTRFMSSANVRHLARVLTIELCGWCDARATVGLGTCDARCDGCDAHWFGATRGLRP